MNKIECLLCQETTNLSEGHYPLIQEFTHSYLILGKHQFYRGYSLLILKNHARELHELTLEIRKDLFNELMISGEAINQTFSPWKMNYASYGNLVEHIHWHIIPRYVSDPRHREEPFCNANEFHKFPTNPDHAQNEIMGIRDNVKKVLSRIK